MVKHTLLFVLQLKNSCDFFFSKKKQRGKNGHWEWSVGIRTAVPRLGKEPSLTSVWNQGWSRLGQEGPRKH